MTGADRPRLLRGVRVHQDRVRGTPVLLGPEVVLMLDEIGAAILAEVDGTRDIAAISAGLAARYAAPADMIAADVIDFLDGLAARRFVEAA